MPNGSPFASACRSHRLAVRVRQTGLRSRHYAWAPWARREHRPNGGPGPGAGPRPTLPLIMCDRVARRCGRRLDQDAGTAVVMSDRPPSPRSSRGLSTLCPPRLFGIGDRRHGQSVDSPASRSASIRRGISVNVAGGLRVAKGQFLTALDTDRTSPFSCEVGLDRLRTEHRALPSWSAVSTPMKHRPFHWAAGPRWS